MIVLTHGYFIAEDEKESKVMKPYVPLGLLYLSAYLDSKQIKHEVFDSTFSTFEKLKSYLVSKQPSLLGLYTNLMTKLNVLKIIEFIKNEATLKHCVIVLGGPEIKHNAENYLLNGSDILVVGEGEQTFFEICDTFIKNGKISKDIDGIVYLSGGKPIFTKDRVLFKDINVIPMPARKKINLSLYADVWKKHHGYSMFSVSTMRGCPYTCKWCSRAVYGGTYRRRSAKLVVDELEYLRLNYHPDRIWFVDDVFTISHKWLNEFKDEVLSRNVIIPYEIITRADRMNDEVISILKQTGCFRVWIGAESGSQKIIDAMDRRVDVAVVREMIIKTKDAGMEAGTFIMLGYPGENKTDIRETIRHLNAAKPSSYTITVAYPITGTPLYDEVSGTISAERPWYSVTDRDYNFKRRHSKKYYENAIRWVYNEVSYNKASGMISKVKFKSKSYLAQVFMLLS